MIINNRTLKDCRFFSVRNQLQQEKIDPFDGYIFENNRLIQTNKTKMRTRVKLNQATAKKANLIKLNQINFCVLFLFFWSMFLVMWMVYFLFDFFQFTLYILNIASIFCCTMHFDSCFIKIYVCLWLILNSIIIIIIIDRK